MLQTTYMSGQPFQWMRIPSAGITIAKLNLHNDAKFFMRTALQVWVLFLDFSNSKKILHVIVSVSSTCESLTTWVWTLLILARRNKLVVVT